jgi:hypothetical protein
MPHCDHCATAELNEHGLRRAHCATCGILCWDDPRSFESGLGFCSTFCEDVKGRVLVGQIEYAQRLANA